MLVRLPCYVLPDYVYELSQLATQTGKELSEKLAEKLAVA